MIEESLQRKQEILEKRYIQMKNGPPDVAITLLLNSISNSFVYRELSVARDQDLHYLILMGVHASILTINKFIFCKTGEAAFKDYLKMFIDGTRADLQFSAYSRRMYRRRNVLAHQWLSSIGHQFGFDSNMKEGVVKRDGVILLNTVRYYDQFQSAFNRKPKTKESIWEVVDRMSVAEKKKAKDRIIRTY